MALKLAHMGSMTCVVCTPWQQWHEAWCGLPSSCTGTKVPKDLCGKLVGEAMGSIPWFDGTLNV